MEQERRSVSTPHERLILARQIDRFDAVAAVRPQDVFLRDGDRHFTYQDAIRISRGVAAGLQRAGLNPGAHVAIHAPNSAEVCLAVLGILRAGCVWATFDYSSPIPTRAATLAALDVAALFYSREHADAIVSLCQLCPNLSVTICLDGEDDEDLVGWAAASGEEFNEPTWAPDDLVTLFSSGGTTGVPKGVMATHSCWFTATESVASHALHDKPVDGLIMPLSHAGGAGLYLCGAALGFSFVVIRRFDPDSMLQAIEKHLITHLILTHTALRLLVTHPRVRNYDLSSLQRLVYGSGPTARDTVQKALEVFGPVLISGFGQTETTTAVTLLSRDDHRRSMETGDYRLLDSCGRVLPHFEVEILAEDGRVLPPGEIGEIGIRGAAMAIGYYKAPGETREATRYGWHHTGDIGRIDADGYLYVLDRKRDMIISRGFKIFPAEIEATLQEHAAVREAAVVGAPDETLGEIVRAVVTLNPNAVVTGKELTMFCRERLGLAKAPVGVEIWTELPKSRVGKILRREIRDRFWEGRERKI